MSTRVMNHAVIVVGFLVFGCMAYAHHASFESDLVGQDSTLENPWRMVNGDIAIAYDHFSFLGKADVDYFTFDGIAGQVVEDLFIVFPASLSFLPKAVIAGPGLSGGSVPDWVEIPAGLGIMNYEYAIDWLTEEAFGELDHTIVLAYDEARPFQLPETGTYWLIIYEENQKSGYYDIAHGHDHADGEDAENWEAKLDDWVKSALDHESSAVSSWEVYD
jgi:hypothetical protein